jgi:hypothetical protein
MLEKDPEIKLSGACYGRRRIHSGVDVFLVLDTVSPLLDSGGTLAGIDSTRF